ncbi:MAG: family 78 glycoside hydrolase catalytic domain, partial [Clostridiales bacterium]|nr:family 78 glycoside hydrolase catalytic domain [Clostridiales bacterium]
WQKAVWRDNPKLLMELTIEYADGSTQTIVTDQSWKTYSEGPLTANDIYFGETWDARLEVPGWESAGFDDSAWDPAYIVKAPAGKLTFENMEPMRRIASFSPEIINKGNGTWILRNPVMATGWAKLSFDAPAGTEITITYGETLNGGGTLNKANGWGYNLQSDKYICKGVPGETFEPKFSYKGYEYIQIENYPGELTAEDVTCYLISNDVAQTSNFETSSDQINALHQIMKRTMLNNMQGKPTDTPVWEKNGWTGDFNVSLETFNYNFDTSAFTAKFLGDLRDAADGRGVVPNIAPTANWGMGNTPVWNTVYINAIYEGWRANGLLTVASEHYDAMRKQALAYISDIRANGWVWNDGQLADWVAPVGGTNPDGGSMADASEGSGICGTGYVYDALNRMAEMADALGKPADAAEYRAAMSSIYDAFNAKFYNPEKGYYETTVWNGSTTRTRYRQTSNLVPLAFGLCPDAYRDSVVASLLKDLEEKDYHLDTGMVGTKLLLPVLSDAGYSDIAFRILTQESYPSWGFWLTKDSTSTWEGYENSARSRNHYFLGTYDEWLFKHLSGIQDMTEGYKTVTIKPEVSGSLTYLNCSVDTVRGTLQSNWRFTENDTLTMDIIVPAGTTASIYLPTGSAEGVTVGGSALDAAQPGITGVSVENGKVLVTAGSGRYSFVVTSPNVTVSKDTLCKTIAQAKELSESDYLASAWEAFQAVLIRAEAMLSDHTVSQSEVNAMAEELSQAIETVKSQPDIPRKELGAVISQADSFKAQNYPAARWEAFQTVMASARALLNDRTASSDQLTASRAELLAAMETLAGYRLGNMALGQPVSASTTINNSVGAGWHLQNLTDGDRLNLNNGEHCGWTSDGDTANDHPEWVTVDLGCLSKFNNVQLMPTGCKSADSLCESFPKDFSISVSSDGVNWNTVYSQTDYPVPQAQMQSFSFESVYARYIRIDATSLRPKSTDNGLYRMQLAEIEVYQIRGNADTTSLREMVSNASRLDENNYPEDAWNRFQAVLNKANDLLLEGSDSQDDVDAMVSELENAVAALQESYLGNLAVGAAISVSSTLDQGIGGNGWGQYNLTDGDRHNANQWGQYAGWTSNNSIDSDHEEWAQLDLKNICEISKVDLYPAGFMPNAGVVIYGFPKDFVIETSTDGTEWTTVVSQTDYPSPVVETNGVSPVQSFSFDNIDARYVRVRALSLNPLLNDGNTYRMQLAEIEIYNVPKVPQSAILSAEITNPTGGTVTTNEPFTMRVTTTADVTSLRLYNEYGLRMGLKNVSFTDEDGVRIWTVSTAIGTAGAQRTLTVTGMGPDGELPSDLSVEVNVKAPVPQVFDAVMNEAAGKVGETVSMTVTTDCTVSRIHVYNLYGLKMGTLSQSYVDIDGVRTWTVTMKIGTAGVRSFLVKGANRYGDVSEAAETNSIVISYF